MSSLAGALDGYTHPHLPKMQYNSISDDVEMTASKNEPEALDDDEEMDDDLFGNDNDVEEHKRLRSVQNSEFAYLCHLCHLKKIISRTPASPTTSGRDSERLPSPERERRQALEYEEEDAPPEISVEVKEAHVSFPNLPVPKSSDGNVRPYLISNPFDSFL
jgi:RNA polymerase-associated protein LEO1